MGTSVTRTDPQVVHAKVTLVDKVRVCSHMCDKYQKLRQHAGDSTRQGRPLGQSNCPKTGDRLRPVSRQSRDGGVGELGLGRCRSGGGLVVVM